MSDVVESQFLSLAERVERLEKTVAELTAVVAQRRGEDDHRQKDRQYAPDHDEKLHRIILEMNRPHG